VATILSAGSDSLTRGAQRERRGTWSARVELGPESFLAITAPTQALADLVASTVRPAG
jgi:hypothetical protein